MIGDRAVRTDSGRVAIDRTLSTTVARVSIPVSLIYDARELIARPEIG